MIIEIPGYINRDFCEEIRESVRPYMVNAPRKPSNRDGITVNISFLESLKTLDTKLSEIFRRLQNDVLLQRFKPAHGSADTGYEYHQYRPGDVCHYHADTEFSHAESADPNWQSTIRYASVVLNLNDVPEGGELVFPAQNRTIKSEAGKVTVFSPYGTHGHYTTPSIQHREVVVTWFVYSGLRVVKA